MKIQRVCIIYNPVSGKGSSLVAANNLAKRLRPFGIDTTLRESSPRANEADNSFLAETDLVIIAGGDGTLMSTLPSLAKHHTPVYMLPTGNESLFAREFKMSACTNKVIEAIERFNLSDHYIATINGTPFFTMTSLGLDSAVIEETARVRKGPINIYRYFMHMVRIVRSHYPPKITLKVDGQTRLTDQEGFLIVANNKQYALGAEFAPEADSRRRELVARFFPYRNAPLYFWWCLRCLLRFRNNSQSTPFFKGKRFEIEIDNKDGYPVQTDGELIGRCQRLLISTTDDRIRVLRP